MPDNNSKYVGCNRLARVIGRASTHQKQDLVVKINSLRSNIYSRSQHLSGVRFSKVCTQIGVLAERVHTVVRSER